jgi:2-oxoglutarate ferredoxin oxidoreductase subunit delta
LLEILIDKNRCKACGLCADVCPKEIIRIDNSAQSLYGKGCAVAREGCIGCGKCYTVCPDIAVTIKRGDKE